MKKLLLLPNPAAGKMQAEKYIPDLIRIFSQSGYLVTVFPLFSNTPLSDILCNLHEYDSVVCCGGDGTLHTVLNEILHYSSGIPVGYIPLGSSNDFASNAGISRDPVLAATQFVHAQPQPVDLGLFDDRYFCYVAAFGLFTSLSYNTDPKLKKNLGHMAYVLNGVRTFSDLKRHDITITHGENTISGEFIFGMVSNSSVVGGFSFYSDGIDLHDGLLECLFVQFPNSLESLSEVFRCIIEKNYSGSPYIHFFRAQEVRLEFNQSTPWTLDGEFGGTHERVCISCVHDALCLKH